MKLPPNHKIQVTLVDGELTIRHTVVNAMIAGADGQLSTTHREVDATREVKKAITDLLTTVGVANLEAMETIARKDTAQISYVTAMQAEVPKLVKASLTPEPEETHDDAPARRKRGGGDR